MQEEPLRYKPLAEDLPTVEIFPGRLSCRGKLWLMRKSCERTALMISQRFGLSPFIAEMLEMRGFSVENLEDFINPTLQKMLPDPEHLMDMGKAVSRVLDAVEKNEYIYIFGDYDVDGATSTAMLYKFLKAIGAKVDFYIPDRVLEGYGPNAKNLKHLHEKGAAVVITVDCGSTAFEPIEAAMTWGMDIIVLDHHITEKNLPRAFAIVNPNRMDETSPYKHVAAVGVCFLFIVALMRSLKVSTNFTAVKLPDIREYLDLVALGTVADVMPLAGLNRAFVRQGLKVWEKQHNLGLRVLGEIAGLDKSVDSYALGYIFGPRINAGGRVGQADLGTRLLTTTDIEEARILAQQLNQLNRERQEIERQVLQQAVEIIEVGEYHKMPFLCVAGDGWHPGVIGIVAGRLKELYSKPTFIVAFEENVGKGSGRSVSGVDLGQLVHRAREKGLLVNGGGHAMAAGITISKHMFQEFHVHLNDAIKGLDLQPSLIIDTVLPTAGLTIALEGHLRLLEPMGTGNPSPKVLIKNLIISYAEVVGENHVRCTLKGEEGSTVQAIAFRALTNQLGRVLLNKNSTPCHVVGTINIDSWQGRKKVQLQIEDILI